MVVFTCAHCGDSVNKPKVEKHYATKCRGRAPNLSCMDCFKDFFGSEHESHTKCISEAQRYGGVGFVDSVKKGEQKQNTWVELVQAALDQNLNTPPAARRILQDVSKHSNTPRKKAKFVNFVRNVCGHRTMPQDIDAAWDVLAVQLERLKSQQAQKSQNNQNGQAKPADTTNGESIEDDSKTENEPVQNKKRDKKRKSESSADSTQENQQQGQANPDDTITTNGESIELVSKSEEKQIKNRKKDKKRKFEATADSTQEKSENQQNVKAKPADTTTPNENSVEGDAKTENEPVKNKKKDKKIKFETAVDSTQESEPADSSTTNGESMDADNKEETAKSEKKGKKRKSQAAADSTQEVTHNGHSTNGESADANPSSSKKQRKEGKKKSDQGVAVDDLPAVTEESEDKNKKRKNEESAMAVEADGDAAKPASSDETPSELTTSEEKFEWRTALTRLVREAGGRLSVAKLRKRLLKEFEAAGKSPEKAERKFEKRLRASTELRVDGDRVMIAT